MRKMPPRTAEHRAKLSANARVRTGNKGPNWQGGKGITKDGYVILHVGRDHPMAYRGRCMEHRFVMAHRLRRDLLPTEVVHHVNGVKDDNRYENLWLWPDRASHTAWHAMQDGGYELRVTMPAIRLLSA